MIGFLLHKTKERARRRLTSSSWFGRTEQNFGQVILRLGRKDLRWRLLGVHGLQIWRPSVQSHGQKAMPETLRSCWTTSRILAEATAR